MTVIIDYGMSNLGSIANMLKKIGFNSIISSDPKEIASANKLILPGVGAFDSGMGSLEKLGILNTLNQKVLNERIPILGICLGMQLMTNGSEEGRLPGLGWIDADTKKFANTTLKIPHMGWNMVKHKKDSKLFEEQKSEKRYYFVHSYYVDAYDEKDVLTTTPYGDDFVSSFEKENIFGVQFHPEKSHSFGMRLLKNFMEL